MISRARLVTAALLGAGVFVAGGPLQAQLEAPSTGGVVALDQEFRMLGQHKRVLMIGAHPDDEDTELLTYLVRGEGAEAAYLSLNRGEGGQNLIGPELGEPLGLIRSEELLAARRLDGARQFFTRAYDFGYSKSLEETWRFWPRDSILKDVVRIVRQFQPQVIVSIFSGTERDGHGQHQAAGWVAREAFRLAGDAAAFPGTGHPWSPAKLYQSTRFDSAATTLSLEGGELDPAVGQTFRQIAMRGRSLHRSQDMGQLQRIGSSDIRLRLVTDRTGQGDHAIFSGIDTGFGALRSAGAAEPLDRYLRTIDSLRAGLHTPGEPPLRLVDTGLRRLDEQHPGRVEIADQLTHLERARFIATGMLADAVAADDRVVPGQTVAVTLSAWNPSSQARVLRVRIQASPRFEPVNRVVELRMDPRQLASDTVRVRVREDAAPTQPYFLVNPRGNGVYQVPDTSLAGLPFEPPDLVAVFAEGDAAIEREVAFRVNDQAFGERRRPVVVMPRIDVKLDPRNEVWPAGSGLRTFTVTLTHGARDTTRGRVTLEVPSGWAPAAAQSFELTQEDERETFAFSLRPAVNLRAGSYEIRAVATDDRGRRYDRGVFTVDYPHIRPRNWVQPAAALVQVAPLEMARLRRVGYVRGASDRVPEALANVGVPIELLDRAALERGDLAGYDAIVIGSRAYETDSALVENNGRLLAYVRNGGLVIVQYQQHAFFRGGFAPLPMTVGGQPLQLEPGTSRPAGPPVSHDRVTDETAPVRIITPSSPAVNHPNRLGPGDWDGWVQERGLYFARSWDQAYAPVLEIADPGEAPLTGGLLVARYGRGTYVYTGLSFFRELPAGVPGAFRLFANLLALGERNLP